MAQISNKFTYFHDFFFIFTIFVNKVCGKYNQKIQLDKCLIFRQDKNHK